MKNSGYEIHLCDFVKEGERIKRMMIRRRWEREKKSLLGEIDWELA